MGLGATATRYWCGKWHLARSGTGVGTSLALRPGRDSHFKLLTSRPRPGARVPLAGHARGQSEGLGSPGVASRGLRLCG
eukprot:334210-Rhodomonas_salina.4